MSFASLQEHSPQSKGLEPPRVRAQGARCHQHLSGPDARGSQRAGDSLGCRKSSFRRFVEKQEPLGFGATPLPFRVKLSSYADVMMVFQAALACIHRQRSLVADLKDCLLGCCLWERFEASRAVLAFPGYCWRFYTSAFTLASRHKQKIAVAGGPPFMRWVVL